MTDAQYPALPDPGVLDFSKKIISYAVLPGATPYDGFAFSDHGTHTAGTLAGDNYATLSTPDSGGHDFGDGMAPNAKIFFQDSGNESTGILAGLMNDYALIFQQAYNAGARINSDSWGSDAYGAYTWTARTWTVTCGATRRSSSFSPTATAGLSRAPWARRRRPRTAFSVGALTNGSADAKEVTSFSSRGPRGTAALSQTCAPPGRTSIPPLGTATTTRTTARPWS